MSTVPLTVTLSCPKKLSVFVGVLSNLHRFSQDVNLNFSAERLYIQGMDAAHICVYEVSLKSDWFDVFDVSASGVVGVKCGVVSTILGLRGEHQTLQLKTLCDRLEISFLNSKEHPDDSPREFSVPMMDIDQDIMDIPNSAYAVSFTMNSKRLSDVVCPMLKFGDVVDMCLTDTVVRFKTSGDVNGDMTSVLMDLGSDVCLVDKYAHSGNGTVELSLCLKYVVSFCAFHKISSRVKIFVSEDAPLRVEYPIGDDDEQYVRLYLAPKMGDE